MALGSTQPLTEMNTRCISGGKGGRCVRLTTLPPSCAVVIKSGNLNFLEPSGPLQACNGTVLPIFFNNNNNNNNYNNINRLPQSTSYLMEILHRFAVFFFWNCSLRLFTLIFNVTSVSLLLFCKYLFKLVNGTIS